MSYVDSGNQSLQLELAFLLVFLPREERAEEGAASGEQAAVDRYRARPDGDVGVGDEGEFAGEEGLEIGGEAAERRRLRGGDRRRLLFVAGTHAAAVVGVA